MLVLLSAQHVSTSQFWLSVEVEQIDWTDGCLTTALCSHPRFQLIKDLLPVNEKVTMNWPIVEHFDKVRFYGLFYGSLYLSSFGRYQKMLNYKFIEEKMNHMMLVDNF